MNRYMDTIGFIQSQVVLQLRCLREVPRQRRRSLRVRGRQVRLLQPWGFQRSVQLHSGQKRRHISFRSTLLFSSRIEGPRATRLPLRVVIDVVQQGCYFPEHSKSAVLQGLVVASVAGALALALEEAAAAAALALVVVEFVRLRSRKEGCPLPAGLRTHRLRRRLRQTSPYRRRH